MTFHVSMTEGVSAYASHTICGLTTIKCDSDSQTKQDSLLIFIVNAFTHTHAKKRRRTHRIALGVSFSAVALCAPLYSAVAAAATAKQNVMLWFV